MIESAIYSILTGDQAVAGFVGTRVYPDFLPQNAVIPSVVYSMVDTERSQTQSGPVSIMSRSFQIDCFHKQDEHVLMVELSKAITDALHGFVGIAGGVDVKGIFFESENDFYENNREIMKRSIDFSFHFKE